MSRILALYMSPRKGGNSDLLMDAFLQGARDAGAEVSALYARDLKIEGCRECGACDKTGECIIRDDMDDVTPLLEKADRVVLATPIFFYGLPSQGKALVDRTQSLWNRMMLKPELKRPDGRGFLLALGATRGRDLFEGTILCMKYFLEAIGLPGKNMESLAYRRIEAKGAVREHETALQDAYEAGRKFGD